MSEPRHWVPVPVCLLLEREASGLSASGGPPVAGVLNVLRTHSEPRHSDHSRYLAKSGRFRTCAYFSLTCVGMYLQMKT